MLSADDVVRRRNEGADPVSDKHAALGRRGHFDHRGEVPGVDFVAVQDVEPVHVMGLVNPKSRVDRIGADARRRVSFVRFVLSGGGYDVFTDGFLPLKNSMMAIRTSPPCWVSG